MKQLLNLVFLTFLSLQVDGQERKYLGCMNGGDQVEMHSTSLEDTYRVLDQFYSRVMDNDNYRIYISRPEVIDTLTAIIYVEEGDPRCGNFSDINLLRIAKNIPIEYIKPILDYSNKYSEIKNYNSYRYHKKIMSAFWSLFYVYFDNAELFNSLDKSKQEELQYLFNYFKVMHIEHDSYGAFRWEPEVPHYYNESIIQITKNMLKARSKYPKYLEEYILETKIEKYNSALYDTIGVPLHVRDIDFYSNIKEEMEGRRRYLDLERLSEYAKKVGLPLEEAYYHGQLWDYSYIGYIPISSIIKYMDRTGDLRLYKSVKKFLKRHPDYPSRYDEVADFNSLEKKISLNESKKDNKR